MDELPDPPPTEPIHASAAHEPSSAHELAALAATAIRQRFAVDRVDLGLILGSGWSAAADRLGEPIGSVDLEQLPGFRRPVVPGHGGQAVCVRTAAGKIALVLTGRTHLYEELGADQVVHGVRACAAAGAMIMVLTNGCGGLNPVWQPGSVVLIRDHINLTGVSPLHGATFVDLTEVYSRRLRAVAQRASPGLPEGVYVQLRGPQYETPAEVRMVGILGGDLVGMSTTLEAIAAREAGMEVLGLSLVTNAAAGTTDGPLEHAEVIQVGKDAAPRLADLLGKIVGAL